jgi:TDG/mug DNA glycosylase family protein
MTILPDLLTQNLKIVFCGTAASDISAQVGAYYANPTNYFWRTLPKIGLTPYPFEPKEYGKLLDYNIGLTDLAKHKQGNDSALKIDDFDRVALHQKILKFEPEILAFTSKKGASVFFQKPTTKIKYGLQNDVLGETHFWVLTSPSGAARGYWDEFVWQALADFNPFSPQAGQGEI